MESRIVKNTGYLYAKVLINIFISLFSTRLILSALGQSDFGLWGVVGGAISFLSFLNPALSVATQRFLSFYEGKGDKIIQKCVFSTSILIHFIAGVFIVFLLEIVSPCLFDSVLNIDDGREYAAQFVYQCMIASLFFSFISVPYDATINAHEDMKYYAIVGVFESFLKLLAALLLTFDAIQYKLETYGICHVVITIIVLSVMRYYCKRHYSEAAFAFKEIKSSMLKSMGKFAFWNLSGSFTSIVGNYGNSIAVNHFFGTTVNAALSITGQLGGYLQTFSANMLKAVNPVIVKNVGKGDYRAMSSYTIQSCKYANLLFSLFAIPIVIETPLILQLWLGQIPLWAVLFIRIHFIRVFIEQMMASLKTVVNAYGRIAKMNIFSSISQFLSLFIVVSIFYNGGGPFWGIIISMIFTSVVPGLIQLYYACRYCDFMIKEYLLVSIKCVVCSFVPLAICYTMKMCVATNAIIELIIISLLHLATFIPVVYILSFNKQERVYLRSLGRNRIFKGQYVR